MFGAYAPGQGYFGQSPIVNEALVPVPNFIRFTGDLYAAPSATGDAYAISGATGDGYVQPTTSGNDYLDGGGE